VGNIGIVSHDAGGAEIISSWVKKYNNNYNFYLDGPAKKIFKKKFSFKNSKDLEQMIQDSEWILCGTSWQSDLEKKAIQIAKKNQIKCISYIDHWVNYKERFISDDVMHLPNEIWVGDKEALKIASKIFSGISIHLIENEYLKEIQYEILSLNQDADIQKSVLYVCEPIKEHALIQFGDGFALGYDEFSALKYFLDNTDALDIDISQIYIRPHPSEEIDKYDWALDYSSIPMKITSQTYLLEDIQSSSYVVGCESMAMVIGLMAKKRVISSIPPSGRQCILPHQEIELLSSLVKERIL
jgi:hypothetical protein